MSLTRGSSWREDSTAVSGNFPVADHAMTYVGIHLMEIAL